MSIQKIEDIEGIGSTYGEKLRNIDIMTADDLLTKGRTAKGRKDMAEKSEISDKLILKWVNMANLARINGVGEEYSRLLETSDIDSVIKLSNCDANDLLQKIKHVNSKKNLVRQMPSLSEVEEWISQAKMMPQAVDHVSSTKMKSDSIPTIGELMERALELEARLDRLITYNKKY